MSAIQAPPVLAKKGRSFGQIFNFLGIVWIHIGVAVALWRGPTWKLFGLAVLLYYVRMFAITAGYHRYFSHRAYRTSRVGQFLIALLGITATQKGPLWWASIHRKHHKYSDTEHDTHSPMRRGFWYSHMGWWMGRDHEETEWQRIPDLTKYPELVWIDKYAVIGPLAMIGTTLALGFDVFLWGFVVSTCLLMHGTFTINSLSHVFGSRRYATTDTSRNNWLLALVTMGEGWHNNHHHYQASARQGFYWWEIDASYIILKILSKVGFVWDLRPVPANVLKKDLLAEVGELCPLLIKDKADREPVSSKPPALDVARDSAFAGR